MSEPCTTLAMLQGTVERARARFHAVRGRHDSAMVDGTVPLLDAMDALTAASIAADAHPLACPVCRHIAAAAEAQTLTAR